MHERIKLQTIKTWGEIVLKFNCCEFNYEHNIHLLQTTPIEGLSKLKNIIGISECLK